MLSTSRSDIFVICSMGTVSSLRVGIVLLILSSWDWVAKYVFNSSALVSSSSINLSPLSCKGGISEDFAFPIIPRIIEWYWCDLCFVSAKKCPSLIR